MPATLVAVALLEALLVVEIASGGELLLCIYPAQQVQGITCSKDGSSLISFDKVQATRLGKDTTECAQEKSRNAPVMSQCTYNLDNRDFYYQFQHPRCNLQRSCIVNGDFPSAIVILGPDSCTADSTGHERNAVIIKWSCVPTALWRNSSDVNAASDSFTITSSSAGNDSFTATSSSAGNDSFTTTSSSAGNDSFTTTSSSARNNVDVLSTAVVGAIIGSTLFVVVTLITAAGLLVLVRRGRLRRTWTAVAVKLHCCLPGSVAASESGVHSNRRPQPVAPQPTVLVIDKHGSLSSALQESLGRKERDSVKKASVQRKTSKKEAGSSAASDLEVEVDTSDDYQRLSGGDLSDACEKGTVQQTAAAESDIPDNLDDGFLPPQTDCERASAAIVTAVAAVREKPPAARQLSPNGVAPLGVASHGSSVDETAASLDAGEGNGFDKSDSRKPPVERGDKKLNRRRQYEIKWNARYGDVTETETDDRRPPPVPPPYVLDPDPNTYQLPWLPSPPDSSDECG